MCLDEEHWFRSIGEMLVKFPVKRPGWSRFISLWETFEYTTERDESLMRGKKFKKPQCLRRWKQTHRTPDFNIIPHMTLHVERFTAWWGGIQESGHGSICSGPNGFSDVVMGLYFWGRIAEEEQQWALILSEATEMLEQAAVNK